MKLTSTLRFRVTVLYGAAFGITLFAFSSFLYAAFKRSQSEEFDRFLFNRAQAIARSISINTRGEIEINQALIAESGKLFPFQFGNEYIVIRSPEGKTIARSRSLENHDLPLDSAMLAQLQAGRFYFVTLPADGGVRPFWGGGNFRMVTIPLSSGQKLQIILQLGVSTHALDNSLAGLRMALFLIGVPLTLLLGGFGGWWLAGRSFQPINRIIQAAQRLGASRLEERLPVPPTGDELERLSATLNEMLDRLEKAFKSQERFVADASHELKTPLTILQGELDVLRRQPRSADEYRAFLESADDELKRLSQIIQNLLLLARADSGRPLRLKEGIRLDEVLLEVIERLQPFAVKNQVGLSMSIDGESVEAPTVRGDADLLEGLFTNLIHNAIKHSSAGQAVEVRVGQSSGATVVSVRDRGAGIPAGDLPHIFDRFYRAENPGRSETKGTGLGLAIAKWIADAHGAVLSVESKPAEGSCFAVRFPVR